MLRMSHSSKTENILCQILKLILFHSINLNNTGMWDKGFVH